MGNRTVLAIEDNELNRKQTEALLQREKAFFRDDRETESSVGKGAVRKSRVLVVDDDPLNVKLLAMKLPQDQYEVIKAYDGKEAIRKAATESPDLILLDIMMPGMDGYEVCRQLKENESLRDIPIIFISALNETTDVTKAFEAGGVDYVAKPFRFLEVKARVETHIRLRQYQAEILKVNQHLEDLVRQKVQQLVIAHERLKILDKAKSDFLRVISHELGTPLNGLIGSAYLLFDEIPPTPANQKFMNAFSVSRDNLLGILDDALTLMEIEVSPDRLATALYPLGEMLLEAREGAGDLARMRGVSIGEIPDIPQKVPCEKTTLVKAFTSLMKTAVKFSLEGAPVTLTCKSGEDMLVVGIEAKGWIIPNEALPHFFEVFSLNQVVVPGNDIGLAPCVAERIIRLFGGSVTVTNQEPPGIIFHVALKATGDAWRA